MFDLDKFIRNSITNSQIDHDGYSKVDNSRARFMKDSAKWRRFQRLAGRTDLAPKRPRKPVPLMKRTVDCAGCVQQKKEVNEISHTIT